jgi:osmotically-inducible protein OsmY
MRAFTPFVLVFLSTFAQQAAQSESVEPPVSNPGVAERIGESVDRGLNTLGQKLRKTWAEIRQSVDELTVQGRVYGRLHWDKSLEKSPIEITAENESTIVLSGTVPDEAARTNAVTLAQSTVGVAKVVDNLTVRAPTVNPQLPPPPAASTSPPSVPPLNAPGR